MKNEKFLEEIKKAISPLFSSELSIRNTSYKGYRVTNFELDKPKLDQTFFPVLRVAKIKINGIKKVRFYLIHSKLKLEDKNKWMVEKIILKSKIPFSIY